jgi:hypothetical protein
MFEPRYLLRRRGMLGVGAAGAAAFGLPSFGGAAGASVPTRSARAKSVLLVLLSGGPSQLDTWDPKPMAPAEIRGEFQSVSTSIPGVSICEHLPLLAARLDRWAIIRSMAHKEHNHLLATHVALTGRPTPIPRGGSDLDRVESRHDFPNFASAVNFVRPAGGGVPTGVSLPNYFIEGPLTWPGQHAGFLGAKHDPWQINHDPNDPGFRVDALSFPDQMSGTRLASRRSLLQQLNSTGCGPGGDSRTQAFGDQQSAAFSLLTSARVAEAFRMDQESEVNRQRYGRNKFGQSLLLARRLVEAGVPVVQAAMGIVQTWDTHVDNWGRLKTTLLPQLDIGLAALIDDLADSGLLEQTMVIVMGEFGRTPKVSTLPGQSVPGRDHWAHAYSILCSGAGILGGQVIGETDSIAAWPLTRSWSPADVGTTLLSALGIPEDAVVMDPLNRPNPLLNGEVISPLYTGRAG